MACRLMLQELQTCGCKSLSKQSPVLALPCLSQGSMQQSRSQQGWGPQGAAGGGRSAVLPAQCVCLLPVWSYDGGLGSVHGSGD